MPDGDLKRIADGILARLPEGEDAQSIARSLQKPTPKALRDAGEGLLSAGHIDLAETLFRAMADCPGIDFWPLQGLARVASRRGRPEEMVNAWNECLRRHPDHAAPFWFIQLARAERERDNASAALDYLRQGVERFPESLPLLSSRPMALFRMWRVEEALEAWSDLIRRFPDFLAAHVDLAGANQELGRWEIAYQIWSDLIRSRSDEATLHWYVQRVVCLLNRPLSDSVEAAISELEARFPDSARGRQLAIDLATKKSDGTAVYSALIEDAVARHPTDRHLLSLRVKHFLAAGRNADAERTVELLEASGDDVVATLSRWQLLIALNAETQVRNSAHRIVPGRSWSLGKGIRICRFLQSVVGSPWAIELALSLSEDLERRFPQRIEVVCIRACLLIALCRNDEALALVDMLPQIYQGEDALELRAWGAVQRGDIQSARNSWTTILQNIHYPALHGPEPHLELVTPQRAHIGDAITLFTPVHNELTNLPHFLQHYRRIGVRQFVIVDNFSNDGTGEYLREQPDVILYRTQDSFSASGSGMRWINCLMDRHGGEWCLYADADEELLYPGCETIPLDKLIEYLDAQGAEAMAGFMLDVYPERLFDGAGRPATRTDCCYYDSDYVWKGHLRCPFVKPEGGVRARVFGTKEFLHKVPLIKRRAGVYLMSHETTPLKLADVTGVFLHYSITDLPNKIAKMKCTEDTKPVTSDRKPSVMRRYEQYASQFESIISLDLRSPGVSQLLGDSLELVDRGLMQAPPGFRGWVAEQRRSVGLCETNWS